MKQFYILIIASGILLRSAYSQPKTNGAPEAPATANQPGRPPEPVRMDLNFGGGEPEKLLAAMEEAAGQMPNVIIHPDAAHLKIPPFKLRDVTAGQVFFALNAMSEPPFSNGYWRPTTANGREIWTLTLPHDSTTIIDPLTGKPTAVRAPTDRNCKVLNLTLVLEDYSVDDVTTAMKGAWELLEATEAPVV
jgi:hypothetical protein